MKVTTQKHRPDIRRHLGLQGQGPPDAIAIQAGSETQI
jgi:hypothetical protein